MEHEEKIPDGPDHSDRKIKTLVSFSSMYRSVSEPMIRKGIQYDNVGRQSRGVVTDSL